MSSSTISAWQTGAATVRKGRDSRREPVLVLGASGFIGQHIVSALASSDWAVPIAASRTAAVAFNGVESVELDATNADGLTRALERASTVVNCVAADARTMTVSARLLFSAAARATRPPRIVHFSSMAVYGSAIGEVDESAPLLGGVGSYGDAKIRIEEFAARSNSVVILRPGIVYGPGSVSWSERIARWLISGRIGDLGEGGDGWCNLVYIDDVVSAVLAAIRNREAVGGPFNLVAPAMPSWNRYFVEYAKVLGAVPVRRISARRRWIESRLFAAPLKIAEKLSPRGGRRDVGLPPPISPAMWQLFRQRIRLNSARARSVLGIQWTPREIGLERAARWFQSL